jgi:hypothetical protein
MIGPFRGGRTRAATGVPSQPNVFYMGQVNGGVWKSDDYGRTWNPIFDHEPTQSIGAIAVAPSDPNIIYVAAAKACIAPISRSATESTNRPTPEKPGLISACATAADSRAGHRSARPNRVFAAVLGHPYGPNEERGLFRSTDGGQTWQKVIYKDENTGGSDVEIDPSNPDVIYASMWEAREGPWEDGNEFNGTGGGLFKSTDGGNTWHPLTNGLPKDLSQIYVAIAPSDPRRLYATWPRLRQTPSTAPTTPAKTGRRRQPTIRVPRAASAAAISPFRGRPEESRHRLQRQHRNHAFDRRRQDLVGFSRRARRRRLPESLDQSQRPQHYSSGQRPGRDRHRERRGRVGVPGTTSPPRSFITSAVTILFPIAFAEDSRRAARSASPAAATTARSPSRLASRGRDRIWLRRARSARPDTCLRRRPKRSFEVSLVHGTGAEHHADPVRNAKYRTDRTEPTMFSPGRPAHPLLRQQRAVQNTDGGNSWQTISPDLTRENPGSRPAWAASAQRTPRSSGA